MSKALVAMASLHVLLVLLHQAPPMLCSLCNK